MTTDLVDSIRMRVPFALIVLCVAALVILPGAGGCCYDCNCEADETIHVSGTDVDAALDDGELTSDECAALCKGRSASNRMLFECTEGDEGGVDCLFGYYCG